MILFPLRKKIKTLKGKIRISSFPIFPVFLPDFLSLEYCLHREEKKMFFLLLPLLCSFTSATTFPVAFPARAVWDYFQDCSWVC